MNRGGGIKSLQELLPDVLKKTGALESVKQKKVSEAWQKVVGPERARSMRVLQLRGNVLVVEVDSAAQMMELKTFSSEQYKKKINESLGTPLVAKIQYKYSGHSQKRKHV